MEQTGKILPLSLTEYVHDAWSKHISAMLPYNANELPHDWLSLYKYYAGHNSLSDLCDVHNVLGAGSTPVFRQLIVTNQNDLITYYFKVNSNACGLNPDYQASKQTTA